MVDFDQFSSKIIEFGRFWLKHGRFWPRMVFMGVQSPKRINESEEGS
jgi:hypothetical protein